MVRERAGGGRAERWREKKLEDGCYVVGDEEVSGCVGGGRGVVWALYVQKVKLEKQKRFSALGSSLRVTEKYRELAKRKKGGCAV